MRAVVLVTWIGFGLAKAASISREMESHNFIHKRAEAANTDDTDFFPFPANKSTITSAATEPKDNPKIDYSTKDKPKTTTTREIPRYFVESKCNEEQKKYILAAWKEAKVLANAQTGNVRGYNYNIPHTQWLGKDWNNSGSWIPWKWNFRKLIGDNFKNMRKFFSNNAQSRTYVYWYCTDNKTNCKKKPGAVAYSESSPGSIWSNYYTTFCPPFYNVSSLQPKLDRFKYNDRAKNIMDYFYLSRGMVMYHETWHYKYATSYPEVVDYAYGPQANWDLAKKKGTNWAYVNADSYATDAVAIYVQQYYSSPASPIPIDEFKKLEPKAAGTLEKPDDLKIAFIPPSKVPLPKTEQPDMSKWEEVHPDKDDGDKPEKPKPKPNPKPKPAPKPKPTGHKAPAELGKQYCFKSDAFGKHADVNEDKVAGYTMSACSFAPGREIKKGDKSINFHAEEHPPYNYTISWEPDCDQDDKSVSAFKPLAKSAATCVSMMQRNYQNCNNGGIGGSITAGCVKYEFKANLDGKSP